METVTSGDGTPIAYEQTGNGPPLVLVHGTTADHTRWEPVRPFFEEHFSLYAIDRRGVGESGDAAEYELEREAEDIAAVVDSIDEPVLLLGHSFGALVSLEAALKTDNIQTLLLYEPYFAVSDQRLYSEELLAEMKAMEDAGEHERLLVMLFEEIVELSPEQMDELRSAPNWPARVNTAHAVYRESVAENEYKFDATRFADMAIPIVLLSGSESPQSVKDATVAVNEELPQSRIVVLPGQGHMAITIAPALFVDMVLASIRDMT